jgi:pilus assembly protein CpaD
MRSKLLLIALCSSVAACNTPNMPTQGVASVNIPVVTASDYVFDAATVDGRLGPSEAARLDGWFEGLGLSYGDAVYVDGPDAVSARRQVAAVAGRYGKLISDGAPVTAGLVQPGSVRVVVSRRRAEVPGCPNWSEPSSPNFNNRTMSNFGCGVNSNLAAMVADPVDLVHGRAGPAASNGFDANKAIQMYREWPLTGITPGRALRELDKANTKKGDQ